MKIIAGFFCTGLILFSFSLSSCRHEPVLTEGTPLVCFQDQVLPLINSNCAIPGCHDGNSNEGAALTNYENISKYVTPGKPNQSKLYEVVTKNSSQEEFMPPSPRNPLTQNQINLISIWILQGAENNSCLLFPCDTVNLVSYSTNIFPVIQNYCTGCHSGSNPSGGIGLENYDQISVVALNGKLYGSVSFTPGFKPMPYQGTMIPECYVAMIKLWVDNGAPNN
jgi:hypothetical protein